MRVEYSENARKQLKKFDANIKSRILNYMDAIEKLENPRLRGKSLVGNLLGIWRYRVGTYRILCKFFDEKLLILVIDIGHRKDIYN
mgnify:CR=1 FL=1